MIANFAFSRLCWSSGDSFRYDFIGL